MLKSGGWFCEQQDRSFYKPEKGHRFVEKYNIFFLKKPNLRAFKNPELIKGVPLAFSSRCPEWLLLGNWEKVRLINTTKTKLNTTKLNTS